jgi:hypothetical protein
MLLISNKNKMKNRFKFCIAFSDNLRGSFIVTMIPQSYEAAMAGRFSMQLSLFPIRRVILIIKNMDMIKMSCVIELKIHCALYHY